MPDIEFADISEFQENFDADPYLKAGHTVIIVRAHNGHRPDHMWPARCDYVRSRPFVAVGYYIYLVESRDAAEQGREFISTVGHLQPNEFPILDLEEGPGNQIPRAEAFFAVVDRWAGFKCSLYTGDSMLNTQLGGPAHWGERPLWIADYLNSFSPNPAGEPRGADWWQYTDRGHFAGIDGTCDGSIYHGSAAQFVAHVRTGAAPAPPPAHVVSPQSLVSVVKKNGAIEVFEETKSGEVLHSWQVEKNGNWTQHWQSFGVPGE